MVVSNDLCFWKDSIDLQSNPACDPPFTPKALYLRDFLLKIKLGGLYNKTLLRKPLKSLNKCILQSVVI